MQKINYKYRVLINKLLFRSGILFINFNRLSDAHNSVIIGKVYYSLRIIPCKQIKYWEKLKNILNWVNAVLTDSDKLLNSDHFALGFETKNSNDLSNFEFSYFECKKKKKNSRVY